MCPSRRTLLVIVLFPAVFLALAVSSYTQKSATWDEPQHVTAGCSALSKGDYRVDPEHPPLLRVWGALPQIFAGTLTFPENGPDEFPANYWVHVQQYKYAHDFLYVNNDAGSLVNSARFMNCLLGVGLGLLLYSWLRELNGPATATLGLMLYVIEPTIAAHSSLATTDAGVACFMFGSLYFLWRTCRCLTVWNALALCLFAGSAIASKFTAVLLFPVLFALLFARALDRNPWPRSTAVSRSRSAKALAATTLMAAILVTSWAMVWMSYGCEYNPGSRPEWLFRFDVAPEVVRRAPTLAQLVSWADLHGLLPNAYVQGALLAFAKSTSHATYLAGEISTTGWWYYFPVAFLLKTPVAVIALFVVGAVYSVTRRSGPNEGAAFLVAPPVLYVVCASAANLNIGVRHILPAYPHIVAVAAIGASVLWTRGAMARVLVVTLYVANVLEFGMVYPHSLTFFNALVGGPSNGHRYLVDSNLDWGQDLEPLHRWMVDNEVHQIALAYFGTANPAYHGIRHVRLPSGPGFALGDVPPLRLPGYVAVSETVLAGPYLDDNGRAFYRPFRDIEPHAVIGNSIRVYWMPRPWW
jgi:hypothetical protein